MTITELGMPTTKANKLIFLWCVPRSISTAFEKMMANSGQFKVYGEPFMALYKRSLKSPEELSHATNDFAKACKKLVAKSKTQAVFVKDMGYHACPFITDSFIKSSTHTFLIRNPIFSVPSLYKMRSDYSDAETGFEGQYELFEKIRKLTGKPPYVIDAESLKTSSEQTISGYFRYIGYQMPLKIFQWQKGSRPDWASRESWHINAVNSEGFSDKPSNVDLEKFPQKVLTSIEKNTHFYEKLLKYAV